MHNVSKLPNLPPRAADSNKGTFGKVLVVAGSRGMSGAAVLTATAALRGGAGLVRVAAPAKTVPIVAAGQPCYTTIRLPEDEQGRFSAEAREPLLQAAGECDVLAVGPGLGQSAALTELLNAVVQLAARPIVLDADGLNAFVSCPEVLGQRQQPLLITPHPGEFARLVNKSIPEVQQQRTDLAIAFAAEHEIVVVLKGYGTLVTDGKQLYRNTTGNPGMATGGSGDVLTGVVAAFLAQGLDAFAAAQLGVYVHGLAGDLACRQFGEVSLIATDVLDYLPAAIQQIGVAIS